MIKFRLQTVTNEIIIDGIFFDLHNIYFGGTRAHSTLVYVFPATLDNI